MTALKWIVRIHKWVALIVGLQIVLWIAGGVVMSVIPIEVVRGEHKIAELVVQPFVIDDILSIDDAARLLGVDTVKTAALVEILGEPVWQIEIEDGVVALVDAKKGETISPLSQDLARRIAEADYNGPGALKSITLIQTPPSEYSKPGPVWRASFNDRDKTAIYVDPIKGAVTARRSDTWRFYDFFWKLHVMDYDDGADFNHPLLITAAGTASFVALSGFFLLIIKMRRSFIVWLASKKRKRIGV